MNPKIDIIIVDFNSGYLIEDCIKSIKNQEVKKCSIDKVIVVNNGEKNIALKSLGISEFKKIIIDNDNNIGFAAACNQGAKYGDSEYILFLNPDTKLMKNSLDAPVNFLEKPENQNIGIVGIQLIDDNSKISKTCSYRVNLSQFLFKILGIDYFIKNKYTATRMWEWNHKESRVVDGVIGAFFFVRRDLFEKLNGFDERFFVYYEETDFGLRANQLGYKSYYLAEALVYHKGGGTSEKVKAHRLFYSNLSRMQYGFKHFNLASALTLFFLTILVEPIVRLMIATIHLSSTEIKNTYRGYIMLWSFLLKNNFNINKPLNS